MDSKEMLDRLVENALDFLSRSMAEFSEQPKFSVINFFTAVELLLKARLLAEHWTLVVAKGQVPDLNKFKAGDFASVSLEEAAEKLKKVIGHDLPKTELETFKKLRDHRNKMVHFFHVAHAVDEDEKLKRAIATEQLTGWFFLYRILSTRWADTFSEWLAAFRRHDKNLRGLENYLHVVFEQQTAEITNRKAAGAFFVRCPSCGFASYEHGAELNVMYAAECLVCGLSEDKCIRIKCPDCGAPVIFVNEGFSSCDGCGKRLEPKDLADALLDHGAAHMAALDGDDSYDSGNCSDCESYQTVIRFGEEYLCTSCLGAFANLNRCHWCNEPNTGDMEDSFLAGCNICDGRIGWDKDD